MLIDIKRLIYIERIAAESKYLEKENKQIIPSLIDLMTGRFYIVLFFSRNGSTAVPISHSNYSSKRVYRIKG